MIKITDTTLCSLDAYDSSRDDLEELYRLLRLSGADTLEMSEKIWELLGKPTPVRGDSLRLSPSLGGRMYPQWDLIAARWGGCIDPSRAIAVIQINDSREFSHLKHFSDFPRVRVVGLDDLLLQNYKSEFETLQKLLGKQVQFCPENTFFCATALAMEWAQFGGEHLVASFAGLDGNAPLEEVVMALRLEKRRRPNLDLSVFARLRTLIETITGHRISEQKPVIGSKIFYMESGIHVDGIRKNVTSYEPFDPQLVGGHRVLVIGKTSGREAIILKLEQCGRKPELYQIPALLEAVKAAAVKNNASLCDSQFVALAERYRK